MGEEIQKIVYKYSEQGLKSVTAHTKEYNKALRETVERTRKMNAVTGQLGTMQSKTITPMQTGFQQLKGTLTGVAGQFFGLYAAVSLARQGFQQALQFVNESIDSYRDFEKATAEVSTILDDVGMQQLPALTAGIETMSMAYGKAATDMARGTYDILSAAFSAEDAMRLLNTSSQAAVAGLTTVTQSVDVFTSILNAYGETVSQAARISDYLFQTVVRGKLRFEDFENSLGYITPIAANAGIAFKEIAAAMSTTTRMGLHADMSVRGLALGIQGFINPTEKAKNAAKEYGVELGALAVRTYGLQGMVDQLYRASQKYGSHVIAEIVPNMRSLRVYSALAGDEGVVGLAEDMDLLTESSGRTEEAMTKMMQTTQFVSEQLAQTMEDLKRSIGKNMTMIELKFDATKQAIIAGLGGGLESLVAGKGFMTGFAGGVVEQTDAVVTQLQRTATLVKSQLQVATSATGGKSLYEALLGEPQAIHKITTELVNYEAINNRIGKQREKNFLIGTSAYEVKQIEQAYANSEGTQQDYMDMLMSTMELSTEYESDLELIESQLMETQSAWDDLTGALDSFNEAEENTLTLINELKIEMNDLTEEIGDVGDMYDGTLGEEVKFKEEVMELEDKIRLIQNALKGKAEDLSSLDKELQEHIKEIQEAKKAYDDLSIAMAKNRLEIMKIQLKGMMRRRGLLRSEEKAIKKFEIDNTKLRIKQLGIQIDQQEQAGNTSEDIVNEELWNLQEKLRQMKDTRQEDIDDLKDTILEKESLYESDVKHLATAQQKMETLTTSHTQFILGLYQNMSEDVRKEFEKMYGESFSSMFGNVSEKSTTAGTGDIKKNFVAGSLRQAIFAPISDKKDIISNMFSGLKALRNFKRGTYSIPTDMPIMAHRGERVIPAGGNGGTTTVEIHNHIQATINNDMDARKLGAELAEGERSLFMKDGKTRFRMR